VLFVGLAAGGLLLVLCLAGAAGAFFLTFAGAEQRASSQAESEMARMRVEEERARESAARAEAVARERAVAAETAARSAADPTAVHPSIVNVTMTVRAAAGHTGVPLGATCTFPVEQGQPAAGVNNCRAMVDCGGVHLYGAEPGTGFFPCPTFSTSPAVVVGADTATTQADRDPTFALDTRAGTVSIADDAQGALGAFRLDGTVTVAAAPAPPRSVPGAGYGS